MADVNLGRDDDIVSEHGDSDLFRPGAADAQRRTTATSGANVGGNFTRSVPSAATGWGRGPTPVDKRKFKYDVNAALSRKALSFSASKVDRLDAEVAGAKLHQVHSVFGIHNENEERIFAFDQGLWYEHAVNGGSTLQAERGVIRVDSVEFDIPVIVKILGIDARRFFRAYADDVARCLRKVLESYDPFDPVSAEMYAAVMQVAVARGLQKYPYLIHDSSDAGVELSIEERAALQASKKYVIATSYNAADTMPERASGNAGFQSSASVNLD